MENGRPGKNQEHEHIGLASWYVKDTYTRHRRSGFSIVEYLVTLTITVLIITLGAAASRISSARWRS